MVFNRILKDFSWGLQKTPEWFSGENCSKWGFKHEKKWFPKAWVITVRKDLSAVYCASPPGYNMNFPEMFEDQN